VVVLALGYRPQKRVLHYVSELAAAGVDVDLVLAETKSTENLSLDERVRVSTILDTELGDMALRRFERAVVSQFPAKVIGKAQSLTGGPLQRTLASAGRYQRRVSRGVRPWLLVRYGRNRVEALDLAGADRIVAADTPAVPLAWRLARRYPDVRATTALDRTPYVTE
jgi:hypothetical protein